MYISADWTTIAGRGSKHVWKGVLGVKQTLATRWDNSEKLSENASCLQGKAIDIEQLASSLKQDERKAASDSWGPRKISNAMHRYLSLLVPLSMLLQSRQNLLVKALPLLLRQIRNLRERAESIPYLLITEPMSPFDSFLSEWKWERREIVCERILQCLQWARVLLLFKYLFPLHISESVMTIIRCVNEVLQRLLIRSCCGVILWGIVCRVNTIKWQYTVQSTYNHRYSRSCRKQLQASALYESPLTNFR